MSVIVNRPIKVMISMASDHAGINQVLDDLAAELRFAAARITDARKMQHWVKELAAASQMWCLENNVDMRGWMQRTRKEPGGRMNQDEHARATTGKK